MNNLVPLATLSAFIKLTGLGTPAISPDGARVAVVVSKTIWKDDRTQRRLTIIDVRSRIARIASGLHDVSSPAFSPAGNRLAFLADDAKSHSQIFVVPAKLNEAPRQITRAPGGIDEYAWRPDGRAFVYAAPDARTAKTGADRFRDSFLVTTEAVVARERPSPDHLFLSIVGNRITRQLTFGPRSVAGGSSLSWSPDGGSVAFAIAPDAIANDQSYSRIAVLDVISRRVRYLTHHTMWEGTPRFSPDGRQIAYLYSNGDPQIDPTRLYVTTPAGGDGTVASAGLDRPIGDAVWFSDGHSLVATAPDETTNSLYRIVPGGSVERLGTGTLVPGIPLQTTGGAATPDLSTAVARDGSIAFAATANAQPPELYVRAASGITRRLTNENAALRAMSWSPSQRMTFPTGTGVRGDAVLYLPRGYRPRRKYPVVIFIHGGPGDPSMRIFDFWAQMMSARGWLVLRPNYRGSPNLGYVYQNAIFDDPEAGPARDIMSSLGALRARGIVDDSRIAVCGWSYGGIMTSWMISRYHIWRAAVSGASVNDWITDYGTADDSLADRDMLRGSPFVGSEAAEWRKYSAITYAAQVTTPVLILSDVGDNRDPFATSLMYWRALRDNHKDATLRAWPIPGHFPGDPVRIADVYRYWIGFIAAHFR